MSTFEKLIDKLKLLSEEAVASILKGVGFLTSNTSLYACL